MRLYPQWVCNLLRKNSVYAKSYLDMSQMTKQRLHWRSGVVFGKVRETQRRGSCQKVLMKLYLPCGPQTKERSLPPKLRKPRTRVWCLCPRPGLAVLQPQRWLQPGASRGANCHRGCGEACNTSHFSKNSLSLTMQKRRWLTSAPFTHGPFTRVISLARHKYHHHHGRKGNWDSGSHLRWVQI